MKLVHTVPAGLVDAGCASLATFGVGLYATIRLSPAGLGTYALFFTAFLAAAVVPTHLLFTPAEIASLRSEPARRLALPRVTFARGVACAALAAIVAAGLAVLTADPAPDAAVLPLTAAAVLTAVVSPLQDHVRRSLHLGLRSWAAASTSVVQLLGVIVCLAALSRLDTAAWVPFAALVGANVASLSVGVALSRRHAAGRLPAMPTADLVATGRWLLPLALMPAFALFLSGVAVTKLAGADVFGHVEAARVLAQPIVVLGLGLMAVLTPRLMEAGAMGDRSRERKIQRPFELALVLAGLVYAIVAAVPWSFSPLPALVPAAYAVSGLLAVTVVSHVALMLMQPYHAALIGARRERELLVPEGVGSALLCLVALAAAGVGAYARPVGVLVQGVVTWGWLRRLSGAPRH